MFCVMLTLALAVVSRRERNSVSSYPSPVVRVSSAHRVELADSSRGTGGWKSTPSVDRVGKGDRSRINTAAMCICTYVGASKHACSDASINSLPHPLMQCLFEGSYT